MSTDVSAAESGQREESRKQPTARQRSTIGFPYDDVETGVTIARAVHETYGGRATREQLAGVLDATSTSGAFRMKISASQMFGLVEVSRGEISTTDLGRAALDPATKRDAKVNAFLSVPLYLALFDRFKGTTLPADTGLTAVIRELGVSDKQATTARRAFQRSAEQAGFFEQGPNRLVQPHTGSINKEYPPNDGGGDHHVEEDPPGMQADPLLASLFQKLPAPGDGRFRASERRNFVTALNAIFTMVYGPEEPEDAKQPEPSAITGNGDSGGTQEPPS